MNNEFFTTEDFLKELEANYSIIEITDLDYQTTPLGRYFESEKRSYPNDPMFNDCTLN